MPIALTIAQPLRHAPPLPLVPLRAPRGLVLSFLIDVFFIADIFVNLRTMVVVEGRLIASTRAIFLHYARSWLALDLVASFPFDWLDGTLDAPGRVVNVDAPTPHPGAQRHVRDDGATARPEARAPPSAAASRSPLPLPRQMGGTQ